MSAARDNDPRIPPRDPYADGSRPLGLPLWRFDTDDVLVARPQGFGPLDRWLGGDALATLVVDAADRWRRELWTGKVELYPGCWLLPVVRRASRGRDQVAALAFCCGAEDSRELARSVQAAGLALHEVADELAQLPRYRRQDLDGVALALGLLCDGADVEEIRAEETVHFSAELAQAYEQVSLLYRLGRSMNALGTPLEFVDMTCQLLFDLLDFAWVAVVHAPGEPAPSTVADTIKIVGALPADQGAFERLVRSAFRDGVAERRLHPLQPESNDLAALVGAQIVLEPAYSGSGIAALVLAGNKAGPDSEVSSVDTQLVNATAHYLGAFLHNVALYQEQRDMFLGTVRSMTAAIDAKDAYTRGHSERVAFLGEQLAIALQMSPEQIESVRVSGLLHDVGKIGVPEAVLRNPGRLSREEFEQIKLHPLIGYKILSDIRSLNDVLPGVLHHHERWDGNGYPSGLAGSQIPIQGRILALADSFDAMSSDRAYRRARSRAETLEEIARCSGSQFDPDLAGVFVKLDFSGYDALIELQARENAAAA